MRLVYVTVISFLSFVFLAFPSCAMRLGDDVDEPGGGRGDSRSLATPLPKSPLIPAILAGLNDSSPMRRVQSYSAMPSGRPETPPSPGTRAARLAKPGIYVMSSLKPPTLAEIPFFSKRFRALKTMGVRGVSVDFWWGKVNPRPGVFDFSMYDPLVKAIRMNGLTLLPIMSFHQCGGNVGDSIDIPLPSWVLENRDLDFYQDNKGRVNKEHVPPWNEVAHEWYESVLVAFKKHYRMQIDTGVIEKIYMGLGPAGELRYPSYDSKRGWKYPEYGRLQCYSKGAIRAFRFFLRDKYENSMAALNKAWVTLESPLDSFEDVQPPRSSSELLSTESQYRLDFFEFYQGQLESHFTQVAGCFKRTFPSLRIAGKVAGAHWCYEHDTMPRAAELCAGLSDYRRLLGKFLENGVELTFTCVEMRNKGPHVRPGRHSLRESRSAARTLVKEVLGIARELKLTHVTGENALPINGRPDGYRAVLELLDAKLLDSFTLLRIDNLFSDDGNLNGEGRAFSSHLRKYLVQPKRRKPYHLSLG